MRLTRRAVYWRLGLVVAVLVTARLAIVLFSPSEVCGVTFTFPRNQLVIYWYDDGAIGINFQPRRFGSSISLETWSGFGRFPYSGAKDFSIGLPVELFLLIFFLILLAFFRIWQLLFHPDRNELIDP